MDLIADLFQILSKSAKSTISSAYMTLEVDRSKLESIPWFSFGHQFSFFLVWSVVIFIRLA